MPPTDIPLSGPQGRAQAFQAAMYFNGILPSTQPTTTQKRRSKPAPKEKAPKKAKLAKSEPWKQPRENWRRDLHKYAAGVKASQEQVGVQLAGTEASRSEWQAVGLGPGGAESPISEPVSVVPTDYGLLTPDTSVELLEHLTTVSEPPFSQPSASLPCSQTEAGASVLEQTTTPPEEDAIMDDFQSFLTASPPPNTAPELVVPPLSPPSESATPSTAPKPQNQEEPSKAIEATWKALEVLRESKISFTTAILTVLDPSNAKFVNYRNRFFDKRNHANIRSVLDSVRENKHTREEFVEWMTPWATDHIATTIHEEFEASKPYLRMDNADITPEWIENWDLKAIMEPVCRDVMPTWTTMLTAATSPKFKAGEANKDSDDEFDQDEDAKDGETRNRPVGRYIVTAQVANLRSMRSCAVQMGLGVTSWSVGAPRQLLSLLHQSALVRCFNSVLLTVETLADRSVESASKVSKGAHAISYDNVQITSPE
ncbi:hypothetical protein NMY22_g6793 [Coprinellus aureogranulatus]|nr:hypothetical protein NMY22_g6793 [Coprinellus aureogranulatus]